MEILDEDGEVDYVKLSTRCTISSGLLRWWGRVLSTNLYQAETNDFGDDIMLFETNSTVVWFEDGTEHPCTLSKAAAHRVRQVNFRLPGVTMLRTT